MDKIKTISDLEAMFEKALQQNLILGFEAIKNRNYLVVHLKPETSDETRSTLKLHIEETYYGVFAIISASTPNHDYLYIQYTDYAE